ncbi:MAG: N-acetylmuramoyl-L-alanine amidase [Alphaproteobacteria bacterium]|nr:MAG: N-acetylmuramoyl-L-alanine amidase [Alphaproteobacteria bacterium]
MDEAGAIACPSPNHGPRRDGGRPVLVVLHYTAMQSEAAALERLCSPAHEVSAHYLVGRTGRLYQLVPEAERAWHAGAGRWRGIADVNSNSIGIELDNSGNTPFSEPLMARLELLLSNILRRWAIGPRGVIGHQDMAPTRKADPGRRFDWRRLARAGLADWPAPAPARAPDPGRFLADAAAYGYDAESGLGPVLAAVRARFRPWAEGPLSAADMAVVAGLALDRAPPRA